MNTDNRMQKRLRELSDLSMQTNSYYFTDFLSPADISLAYEVCRQDSMKVWGGADGTERAMVRFGSPEEFGYEVPFPIVIVCIRPKNQKFAQTLTHRDYLGSLMSLGMERDVIGDILLAKRGADIGGTYMPSAEGLTMGAGGTPSAEGLTMGAGGTPSAEGLTMGAGGISPAGGSITNSTNIPPIDGAGACVFVAERMAGYITDSLTRIKHTDVVCEILPGLPPNVGYTLEKKNITAASGRLDGIIAKLYHFSRNEAKEAFSRQEVFLNGRICANPSTEPREGDIISVRHKGKCIYRGISHETRKGNRIMELEVYV